jgi:protein phosphatase
MSAMTGDVIRYATGHVLLVLPNPDAHLISTLFRAVGECFSSEPTLLELSSPCRVIGDIHGQILDLFRMVNTFGLPGSASYLFLGDLVDRGEFSIECLVCVFLLKILWPDQVWIIRGNHEFSCLSSQCGFFSSVLSVFGSETIFEEAIAVFAQIPLAARIDGQILCVHGGIGPAVTDVSVIAHVERPLDTFEDEIVVSLVWSDPNPMVDGFRESPTRGAGYLFGEEVFQQFLERSHLTLLVRGHECVKEGAAMLFNDRLITVFSASNYCGLIGNKAAVLEISGPNAFRIQAFPPLPWLLRSSVRFGRDPGFVKMDSGRKAPDGIRTNRSVTGIQLARPRDSPLKLRAALRKSESTRVKL